MELYNRRDGRLKDHFWDLRAGRAYGRGLYYGPEIEAWTCVETSKEEGCTGPMNNEDDKTSYPA